MFPSWRKRAKPKSAIFKQIFAGAGKLLPQLCDNRMFCGFRSLCTIPLAKRAFMAPAKSNQKVRSSTWMMQFLWLLTKLDEKQADGVFTEGPLDCKIVGEVASIAILHDKIDIVL